MNPVAYKTTIDEAYRRIIESGGEFTDEVQELIAISEGQKEMALQYFVERRVDRELVIAEANGRIAWHKQQIEALEENIKHQESVIRTADKALIQLIESIPDAKTGLPSSKVTIDGQVVKVTTGNSSKLIVDDITLIPETFIKCTITFPKDRLQYIKMVLEDDEISNIKEAPDVVGMKKSGVVYQGTHIETETTKYIKRMG